MHFLGISGSLRSSSTNVALLQALASNALAGYTLSVYDGFGKLPIFNPDDEGERTPTEVLRLVECVTQADGLIIACPEYAHGIPGGIKNALDWLVSGPAAVGKPAMLVHASPRSLFARAALREVLKTMSFDIFDGAELEIKLIGLDATAIREPLAAGEQIEAMNGALAEFGRFVVQRRTMEAL